MTDFLPGPIFVACYVIAMAALLAACVVRLHRSFTKARAFLTETGEWTLQVRNEDGFRVYRKSIADEAIAQGGFFSVWNEFLDEIHIRYDSEGKPLAESSTEALEKVRLELTGLFERSHRLTRLCALALAVAGLVGAVAAVGAGALAAVPFLEQTPADAPKALGALFETGGLAFVAAAAGLLGAIVFRAVERWQLGRVEKQVDALSNHLRGFVSFRSEPYYLAELTYSLRNERGGMKEFGQALLDRLSQGADATLRASGETQSHLAAQSHSLQTLILLQQQRASNRDLVDDARVVMAIEKLAFSTSERTDALAGVAREQTSQVVATIKEQTDLLLDAVSGVKSDVVSGVVTGIVDGVVTGVVNGVVTGVVEGVVSGVVTGVRGGLEQQSRDLRQAIERLGLEFGAALHVSSRDLQSSLSSLSDTLTAELRGVHAVHFAEASVLTRVSQVPHGGALETPAESTKPASSAGSSGTVDHEGSGEIDRPMPMDSLENALAPLVRPQAVIEEIPGTLKVMLGCLDLLQSGLRGLGTLRAQLDYLKDTCDRIRRVIHDVQSVALPLDMHAEKDAEGRSVLPAWWNDQASRVVEALARIDDALVLVKEQAQGYEPVAEAQLGEQFVQLGRAVETLWMERESGVPAILENLWVASRTPSQLVKGVTSLKGELAQVCRALILAQRHALSLEITLGAVWQVAGEARLEDTAFWTRMEACIADSLRASKALRAARRRIVFPHALIEADVIPMLASLAKLVEETQFCVGKGTLRKTNERSETSRLPKAG